MKPTKPLNEPLSIITSDNNELKYKDLYTQYVNDMQRMGLTPMDLTRYITMLRELAHRAASNVSGRVH